MINYISKFFNKQSNNITAKENINNGILFEIDQNEKTDVIFQIGNMDANAASQFGFFLFLLNEGYYVQTMTDILLGMAKEGGEKAAFSQNAISMWSKKILESEKYNAENNDPIIKPTQFHVTYK